MTLNWIALIKSFTPLILSTLPGLKGLDATIIGAITVAEGIKGGSGPEKLARAVAISNAGAAATNIVRPGTFDPIVFNRALENGISAVVDTVNIIHQATEAHPLAAPLTGPGTTPGVRKALMVEPNPGYPGVPPSNVPVLVPTPPEQSRAGWPTDQPWVEALHVLYRRYYNRDATFEEIEAHRGNPGGLVAIEAMLKTSMLPPVVVPSAPGVVPPAVVPSVPVPPSRVIA